MNANTRLTIDMTVMDAVLVMGEENPGAITTLVDLIRVSQICDPYYFAGVLGPMLALDSHGIYGSKIWVLRKDVCNGSLLNMLTLMRCCQMGVIGYDTANEEISRVENGQRTVLNFKDLLQRLQTHLPNFGKNYTE